MITPERIAELAASHATPFYLYDLRLLRETLDSLCRAAAVNPKFRIHYAMKACRQPEVLDVIRGYGLGADTVSGGEIALALRHGFDAAKIFYAGVGKTDAEIDFALRNRIGCFNVESVPELEVISERAVLSGTRANVALRVNPEIDAHTHHYITTGLSENKFGISLDMFDRAVDRAMSLPAIDFAGLHFHIGSQITITEPFKLLCERINNIVRRLCDRGIEVRTLNVGGGLAIDYDNPLTNPVPDFNAYFDTVSTYLDTDGIDTVHFEPGRAVVGQCGTLVTKVLYVKTGDTRTFTIVDAGMTDLIRPALYGARHGIDNISGELRGESETTVTDIVGPVCESADEFGKDYRIPTPSRGDILAVRSAGAYGAVMASGYNARPLAGAVCEDGPR